MVNYETVQFRNRPVAPLSVLPDVDLVRSYLRDIGRVPLLSHQQEITLGRQVQELM
ncbi:sigma-70 factor domain-containing protein, partial [Synechococcus sp. BS55D]|uniref:sigma-70 factor domain-containing protein n=1 Tax=Synechococcus sp. BS55D TaxID=2055943 RepID=UPI002ED205E1